MDRAAKRIGVIGAGRIGSAVIAFLRENADHALASVLTRHQRGETGIRSETSADAFFANELDLIIETAGPTALRAYGVRALSACDVWSVSASALADEKFRAALDRAGGASGHRLRLISGSVSGLDGVAAFAVADPSARLRLVAQRPGISDRAGVVFSGSLAEAARRHSDEINFAMAAKIAADVENATIELSDSGGGGAHTLGFYLDSVIGAIESSVTLQPLSAGRLHPVAASLIAALKRETQTIWAG